jgi:hypothetical protein
MRLKTIKMGTTGFYSTCLLMVLLNAGCTATNVGVVRLTNDSFKKEKFYSLKLRTSPEEPGLAENIRQAKQEFFRDEAAMKPSVLTLTIKTDESEPDIREEIYIKIDDAPIKAVIGKFEEKLVSQPYLQTVNEFGYIGQSNTVSTMMKSKIYRIHIEFTKDEEAALKVCKTVVIRAYVGNEALNIVFNPAENRAIRNFFAGVPDETKSN